MNHVRSWLVFGVIIWAVATAVFVPFGHLEFGPDNRFPITLSVSATVVAAFLGIYACAVRILRVGSRRVDVTARPLPASALQR